MAGKATEDALDLLHGLIAESMTDELRRAVERARAPKLLADEKGELTLPNPAYEALSPKLLAVLIKFLKDNGIDAPASSPRFNSLAQELKDLDLDSIAAERPN